MMFPYTGIVSHEEFLLTRENAHDLILTMGQTNKQTNMIPIELVG